MRSSSSSGQLAAENQNLWRLIPTHPGHRVAHVLLFSRVWRHVAEHIRLGGAANEIDVLVTNYKCPPLVADIIESLNRPIRVDLSVPFRAGVYLFPQAMLQDLDVTSNNRAVLIPKKTIEGLIGQASELGLFAPLPLWYTVYAQERPPDMYSAQRAEYDARFSARGDLDR